MKKNIYKYDFYRFDPDPEPHQAMDLNPNWTGQRQGVGTYTANQDLSPEMKSFYDRMLIRLAEPKLVHDQFGQKRPIPSGNGKTIEFRQFKSLPKLTTALVEGITPRGQSVGVTSITATISQYGGYITTTDLLNLTAFDNTMAEFSKLLGSQAGRTSDTLTRDVIAGGTNVMFADAAGSGIDARNELGASDVLTVGLIKKAVTLLKRNNAEPINGSYVAIVHPDTVLDLWNDDEWIEASEYAGSTQIFNGEVGKLYGVRFVQTTEAKIWKDNTCPNVAGAEEDPVYRPVYGTIFLGANAFGVTSINNGGIETIIKQLGSGGTADPLNQRATMGWKLNKVAKILVEEYMVRVEHTTSMGLSAEAN